MFAICLMFILPEVVMFKTQEEQVSILGICVDSPLPADGAGDVNFMSVQSGRRAIDMLRMMHFDFILVGMQMPDIGTRDLLRMLKTAWPQQKWALVGGPISEQQEIAARMFGATTLFDASPSADELVNLTARIREHAIQNVLAGRFGRSPAKARAAAI
jgi:DNA-binding NarL/FixJ family response regulator